jgi:hypothetical protein
MTTDLTIPEVIKESARALYVLSGQDCKSIATALQVNYKEVEAWKKDGNWATERSNQLKASIIELRDRALERVLLGSEGFQKNISALLDKTISSLLSEESSGSEEQLKKLERLWHLGKEVYGIDIAREAAKAYIQGAGNGVTYQNMMQINNNLLNAAVSDRVQRNINQVTDLA